MNVVVVNTLFAAQCASGGTCLKQRNNFITLNLLELYKLAAALQEGLALACLFFVLCHFTQSFRLQFTDSGVSGELRVVSTRH